MENEQGTSRAAGLLDRMLDPVGRSLGPEAARRLVELRADAAAQLRMDELADKCTEGSLSSEERAEYEAYVVASNVIAVLQSKARRVLAEGAGSSAA